MKVITIGRSEECSIVVNDEKVSRVHAQLVQDDQGVVSVVDLGSTNGTWVNESRIVGEMRLNPNDKVRIGSTQLSWQTYINNMSSQQLQPEMSHSVASTTVLGESDDTSASSPEKNPQHKTMWIVIAIGLALCVGGGVVWLLTRPSTGDASKEGKIGSTDTHDPANTINTGQGTEPTIVKDSLDSIVQRDYEQALINAVNRRDTEAKRLKNELAKTQDSFDIIKSETLDDEFKKKVKDANEMTIYMTYRDLVDLKLVDTNTNSAVLYKDLYFDPKDIDDHEYNNRRYAAIQQCYSSHKDKKKDILNTLKGNMVKYTKIKR